MRRAALAVMFELRDRLVVAGHGAPPDPVPRREGEDRSHPRVLHPGLAVVDQQDRPAVGREAVELTDDVAQRVVPRAAPPLHDVRVEAHLPAPMGTHAHELLHDVVAELELVVEEHAREPARPVAPVVRLRLGQPGDVSEQRHELDHVLVGAHPHLGRDRHDPLEHGPPEQARDRLAHVALRQLLEPGGKQLAREPRVVVDHVVQPVHLRDGGVAQRLDRALDGGRAQHVVGVEHQHGIAGAGGEAGVDRRGLAEIRLQDRRDARPVGGDDLARVVSGAVVHDDHLDAAVRLVHRAVDRFAQPAAVIVVGDDDAGHWAHDAVLRMSS